MESIRKSQVDTAAKDHSTPGNAQRPAYHPKYANRNISHAVY